jgi:ATP-dependent Clp protease adaptor protein ClpS
VPPVALPVEDTRTEDEARVAPDHGWTTVVWNDPVNLMSYVTWVFRTYFGYPHARAVRLMLRVHHEGRAVVSRGSLEEMERDTQAMHGYGLWATVEPAGAGDGAGDGPGEGTGAGAPGDG